MEKENKNYKIQILLSEKFNFGYAMLRGCNINALSNHLSSWKNETQAFLQDNNKVIEDNILKYVDFFHLNGYKCPLSHQFKTISTKGFNTINPFVDVLLINEMRNGMLMGVQDFDKIEGTLSIRLAKMGENFEGMFKQIECKQNEIVICDEGSIIASYFQGPDKKTMVSETTLNAIIFIFSTPEISNNQIEMALKYIKDTCSVFCNSIETKIV